MKSVFALMPAAIVAGALISVPAEAKCEDNSACVAQRIETRAKAAKASSAKAKAGSLRASAAKPRPAKASTARTAKARPAKAQPAKAQSAKAKSEKAKSVRTSAPRRGGSSRTRKLANLPAKPVTAAARIVPFDPPNVETGNHVVEMIQNMSPGYGVPTWFALRIAKIESNYNPAVRGRAGEYGIYQIKCDTARGLGFSGNCSALSDARTNIHWGLTHLAEALKSSAGNLRLAASKHNAGLGRRTIVPHYVGLVF
jgi:soluble lytic murein transglycosylase-like protein